MSRVRYSGPGNTAIVGDSNQSGTVYVAGRGPCVHGRQVVEIGVLRGPGFPRGSARPKAWDKDPAVKREQELRMEQAHRLARATLPGAVSSVRYLGAFSESATGLPIGRFVVEQER